MIDVVSYYVILHYMLGSLLSGSRPFLRQESAGRVRPGSRARALGDFKGSAAKGQFRRCGLGQLLFKV